MEKKKKKKLPSFEKKKTYPESTLKSLRHEVPNVLVKFHLFLVSVGKRPILQRAACQYQHPGISVAHAAAGNLHQFLKIAGKVVFRRVDEKFARNIDNDKRRSRSKLRKKF